MNLYGFASGDPVSFSDPFGFCPWCIGAGIGAVAGAAYTIWDNNRNGRPLTDDLLRNTLIGGAAGATLGLGAEALAARGLLASAAAGGAGATGFAARNGQRVSQLVETTAGQLEVSFKVAVDGARLTLSNLSVFPAATNRLSVGTGQMLNLTRQLIDAARTQGFEQIRITGYRVSGADPGHMFEIVKNFK
jgi:hypothetical protein